MGAKMRPLRLAMILAFLLLCSGVANVGFAWLVREQYREVLRVRLDPTSEERFVPQNASLEPPPDGGRRVVFLGDSRTEMWRDLPPLEGCQVVNRGRGHDTSGQVLLRVDRDAIALEPSLVFLEIGANDLKSIGVLPDRAEEIEERLRANVLAIIDRLTGSGLRVVVSTTYPFGEVSMRRRPFWSDRIVEAREKLNRELRRLQRPGVTVFDADEVLASGGRMKPEYQLDELHLNASAYRALNEALPAVIERGLDGR